MSRPSLRIALLALLIPLLCAAPAAATDLAYTGQTITIASPGSYVLTNDIVNCSLSTTAIEIRASNVVLDGGGHLVDGQDSGGTVGITVHNPWGARNVTVRNVRVRDWDYGVYLQGAVDSRIESSVLEENLFCGAVLYENAERNTVDGCTVTGNVYGLLLSGGADDCTVSSNRIENNECGLYLYNSDGVTVTRNVVAGSTDAGLRFHLSGGGTIYDNRFENALNADFTGAPVEGNAWSVTPLAGPNIVGCPSIGGNFWARPDGKGFSEITADGDSDGFADGALTLAAQNVDARPLAPSVGYAPTPETTPTPDIPVTETSVPWIPTPVPLTTSSTPTPTSPAVTFVPGGSGAPTDPDGDGLYDDVNGNGRQDFSDVVLYFSQMTWIAGNEPVSGFDYNRNGRIDFADVVALFVSV